MTKKFPRYKNFVWIFLLAFLLFSCWSPCLASTTNGSATKSGPSKVKLKAEIKTKKTSGYFAPILTFHHIGYATSKDGKVAVNLHYSPVSFENLLKNLQKENYQTVFASEMAAYLAKGQKPPSNWVALTFDDGYEDFYTNALPLLKKYGDRASLYIITSRFSGDYLTKDQIREIDDSGLVEIGSHTVSHPQLPRLSSAGQLKELRESKADLERLLKKNILSICYPSGSYNQETEVLAKQIGYQFGFTYNHRPFLDTADRYVIDRVGVWPGMNVIKYLKNLNKL